MLEQRIEDKRLIRLIKKWLKAGVLNPDGLVSRSETGTPQGGIISPILANIYLHFALDLWFYKKFLKDCDGKAYLIRYADDFVCAFQYKKDAERFYKELSIRLKKFNLELSFEKTNLLRFSRFDDKENSRFDFLGFEYRWEKSRNNKVIIKRRTSRKKFRKSCETIKEWIKCNRHLRCKDLFKQINKKLQGYYNYYGVINNYKSIKQYYTIVKDSLFKWLNRRGQKKSFSWKRFLEIINKFKLKKPKIVEKRVEYNNIQLLLFSFN